MVTDFATAELVKVAANAFLATKISFINAMAEVCEATGADVTQLSEALSHDARIGGRFLHAGLGFGGGCLPKDIRAFMARAGELGVDQALSLPAARSTRSTCAAGPAWSTWPASLLDGVVRRPPGRRPRRGLQAEQRRHPRLPRARRRRRHSAGRAPRSRSTTRQAMDNARRDVPAARLRRQRARGRGRGADVVLHLTEWQEFREMDPAELADVVAERRIVDGRNALDPELWRAAGWTYRALGRP